MSRGQRKLSTGNGGLKTVAVKSPREKSPNYLKWIRGLPCCVCSNNTSTEAAHIRFGEPRAAKRPTGIGEKSDDRWALPLCSHGHREQHSMGERVFWRLQNVDPIFLSMALQLNALDTSAAEQIIEAW